jgi:PAS domain S-box-containing protein
VGCSGIARDITECKRAEEALRKSEERFRLAAQAGKMYAYEWDVATDMIVRSGDIGRVLGSTGEASLTSQKLLARVHPDDRALFDASVAECTREHPDVQISYRLLRPDGSVVWLEKTARALFDGQDRVVRMIGMVADITERRLAEEARFRHAAIVESSEDAIISKNLDAVIVSWNAGAQHIFGYTESEAVGQPITILIPPESWDEENKILERLRAGEHIDHYETVRVTKAGNTINVSLSLSPIKDSTGRIMGFCKIARDITERKRAEEARRESEERLRLAAQIGRMFAYSWDAATDVIERSGESAEILGVQKQAAATGATVSAMVHPDDKGRLEAALAKLNSDNPVLHITYRILRPDGRSFGWSGIVGHTLMATAR